MFNKGGMSEVIWDPLFCFLHLNIIPDLCCACLHPHWLQFFWPFVDNMVGFRRCIKQICVFVQRPFDVLHTIPAMFTSSCQLATTPAQLVSFSVWYISLYDENWLKKKNPDLSSFLFGLDNQMWCKYFLWSLGMAVKSEIILPSAGCVYLLKDRVCLYWRNSVSKFLRQIK